jgi:hypothetical protein
MISKKIVILIFLVFVLIIVAITVYQFALPSETTLEIIVQDSVSGNWVWDLEITMDNNIIHGYFQSDTDNKPFKFRNLTPGEYTIGLSAPHYRTLRVPVTVKRGKNIIHEPFRIEGYEIPDLDKFLVFEELIQDGFIMNLRPVSTTGRAIINHPCMDLWIGFRVTEQMIGNDVASGESETEASRGKELFKGKLDWTWDPEPEVQFRYYTGISVDRFQSSKAEFLVFDYLILIPEKGKIGEEELANIINETWLIQDHAELIRFLQGFSEQLSFYIDTSWNVRGIE